MGVMTDLYGDDVLENPFIHRGVVEDNIDPDKAGRIKIRILGIHSDNRNYVTTKQLPWAIPATSIGLTGGGLRNIGFSKIPDVGSHVWLFFEGGDHNYPVYFAMAPAIEDVTDYQQKEGKLKEEKDSLEYKFEKNYQYDDDAAYQDTVAKHETPNDDKSKPDNQVQDWSPQTRKNTFGEDGKFQDPPPGRKKDDPQPIFPKDFFQKEIRIAFNGAANHDAPKYDGIGQTKPSAEISDDQRKQELDKWDERKWGHNDDDTTHQHNFKGGKEWKPTYPMCSTERNAQGEIIDTDILKERRTYIHPSKYFIEYIQLDADRKAEDFRNEKSIKNIYERQRGKSNSPSLGENGSNPKKITRPKGPSYTHYPGSAADSNENKPIYTKGEDYDGRKNNDITYDDIDLKTRKTDLKRFEERKHNPGREKTVIEDFVYRFYMNKVNETYQTDRNTRIYRGNNNIEIEHGDNNERYHRGSKNYHLDDGNFNTTINRGWHHTHIDHGHQFVEIYGKNEFTIGTTAEEDGNPNHSKNQHSTIDSQIDAGWSKGADKEGCDAKFSDWEFEGENEIGNQFFLLHKGHQIFRLEKGHQHYQLNEGHQKFWLKNGHQTYHLVKGDQRFQLDKGNMERIVNGKRVTLYYQKCKEVTQQHWQMEAATYFKIKSPTIILDGDVRVTGNVQIDGNVKCGIIDSPGGKTLVVGQAEVCGAILPPVVAPSGSASVSTQDDSETISEGSC